MADEQTFIATRKVFALYAAFFKAVAQEIGVEKALALHASAHAEQGIASAKPILDKIADAPLDIQKLGSILPQSNLSLGIHSDLAQVTASWALFKNSQCPMYDGYRMGGLDDATAEEL